MEGNSIPTGASEAILKKSDEMPPGSQKVEELDFNKFTGRSITVDDLVEGMTNMGFQASSIGEAIQIINEMVRFKNLFLCSLHNSDFGMVFTVKSTGPLYYQTSSVSINQTNAIRPQIAGVSSSRNQRQNHHLLRLYIQSDIFRSPRHVQISSPTFSYQCYCNNRWWSGRRSNKMSW